MDGKDAIFATQPHIRDAFKMPNFDKPPVKTVTVSAAGLFKSQKLHTRLQPGSHSTQKSTSRRTNRKKEAEEEVHPLALTFKVKSEDYRRNLYSIAANKINKDLDALLNRLYESNLQGVSSGAANENTKASPLKLTVPVKYQRMVEKLCRPLNSYQYIVQKTTTSGDIESTRTSLHERFQSFEETIQAETEQIRELQRQWEGIVAEIFQLGIACLGEADIAALLSTANASLTASSPGSKASSTLFVPKNVSPVSNGKGKRKRVSFARSDMMVLFPQFLLHAQGNQKPVAAAPVLPLEEMQRLEKEIAVLGKQHSADLRRLEHEHKAWWIKKQKHLAHTFMQD